MADIKFTKLQIDSQHTAFNSKNAAWSESVGKAMDAAKTLTENWKGPTSDIFASAVEDATRKYSDLQQNLLEFCKFLEDTSKKYEDTEESIAKKISTLNK